MQNTGNSTINKTALFWMVVTFTTAMCSILYELVLAQTLSSVMGNTAHRYNLTIGLYIASMGLGAVLVDKISKQDQISYFMRIEILISIFGAIFPWLILIHDSGMQSLSSKGVINYFSSTTQLWLSIFNNGMIVLIGFLSGLELPLLMRIGKSVKIDSSFKVLSLDYFGTTVGAILFPLVLFPNLNLFTMVYVFSMLNILVSILVAHHFKAKKSYKVVSYIWLAITLGAIFYADTINSFLVNLFYFKG